MRPIGLYGCFQGFIYAFRDWLKYLGIIAHQVIAYLRRIRKDQSSFTDTSPSGTNVELTPNLGGSSLASTDSYSAHHSNLNNSTDPERPSQQLIGSHPSKTPHKRKLKLTSIFRRLSFRNFMDYCVIALNEASSSGCSNKFDLNSCSSPVWLLGQSYQLPSQADQFVDDIRSKLWITYRKNFPPIDDNTRYTTDRGFGCMIRCGQMVLANALLCKNLGRHWRWSSKDIDSNPEVYLKILKLFQDRIDKYYSIHQIIQLGQQEGKSIGEWFGPNTIAQALKKISMTLLANSLADDEVLISIDAALDNVVVIDEIKSKFKRPISNASENGDNESSKSQGGDTPGRERWSPGLLFIQLRLGLTKINPLYFAALKKTFQFADSLGIIGGRPNHALYLIGYTNDDIIYLDPHSTQEYIDFDKINSTSDIPTVASSGDVDSAETCPPSEPLDVTYHCSCPEKMPLDRLDPSLALCFFFKEESDFDKWCEKSQELLIKSEQAPMFEITKSRPSDWNTPLTSTTVKSTIESNLADSDKFEELADDGKQYSGNESNNSDHEEEFEMLA